MRKVYHILFYSLFFLLLVYQVSAQDIMSKGGTLTVNEQNGSGADGSEGSNKLIDNNTSTKFLVNPFVSPLWAQFKCNAAAIAAQYTMTSGGDASNRDPMTWQVQGSNDGATWTVLDSRKGETFANRGQTNTYDITTPGSYLYYRLYITAIAGGSGLYQQAEWRLLEGVAPDAAPTNLTAKAISGTEVLLNWTNAASNAAGFIIERSIDNGATYTEVGSVGLVTVAIDSNGLIPETPYRYRLRASNKFGATAPSAIANATTLSYGGVLVDLTDDGGALYAQFANSDTDEDSLHLIDNSISTKYLIPGGSGGYNASTPANYWFMYKSTSSKVLTSYALTSGGDAPPRDPADWELSGSNDSLTWTSIDKRTGEAFASRGLTRIFTVSNKKVFKYFKVQVTANFGPYGDGIPGQIAEWQLFAVDPTAPYAPVNPTITNVDVQSITLKWTKGAGSYDPSGYEIQRSRDSVLFDSVGAVGATVTAYLDENLLGGTKYFYRVRALGSGDPSVWSNIIDTTTIWDPTLPLTPDALSATPVSENEVLLNWTDRSDIETGVRIERSLDGINYVAIDTVGVNVTTYSNSGLTKATQYWYRVMAFNDKGTSNYSNIADTITLGQNVAPTLDGIADINTCRLNADTILLTGITPGIENYQTVTVTVTSDNSTLFSDLSVGDVIDGTAKLAYTPSGIGDTALVTVTIKDNGLALNGGADTYVQTFTVIIDPLQIHIVSDKGDMINRGETVTLTASGAESYVWDTAHGVISGLNSPSLVVHPTINTTYYATGSNSAGCTAIDSLTLQFSGGDYNLQAVNIMTPNGDNKNDYFVIYNISSFPDNKVKVYDRAGRMVFYKQNYTNDWNGTYQGSPLPEGTYIYVIDLGSGIKPVKGTVTIIRDRK